MKWLPLSDAWCCFAQRGKVWQPSDVLHSWLCVSSNIPGSCTRVLVLSVTSSEPLCPARGICAGTTLAWNTAALLQPPCEITALFRILAPLNPNKGSNTSNVSGRNDKLIMSFKLQRLAPLQGVAACLPYLFLPSRKSVAGSSMQLKMLQIRTMVFATPVSSFLC